MCGKLAMYQKQNRHLARIYSAISIPKSKSNPELENELNFSEERKMTQYVISILAKNYEPLINALPSKRIKRGKGCNMLKPILDTYKKLSDPFSILCYLTCKTVRTW